VYYRNQFFALPLELGQVDLDQMTDLSTKGVIIGDRLEVLFDRLPDKIPPRVHAPDPTAPPRLLFPGARHNIVSYRDQFFAIPLALGPVDLYRMTDLSSKGIIVADRLDVLSDRLAASQSSSPR
jgi:hypothetical protein